jgi:formylglycine-generating enzyme required for sulfatase activity
MTSSRTATFLLRQPRQAQGFREPLTDGLALTMLWIPPGSFWMGSPEGEEGRSGDEGPLHLVRPRGYFMGQTPITQAQWREVAVWKEREGERWGKELKANPSYFQTGEGKGGGGARLLKGEASTDERPVENVSWEDAMEFCDRLSQRTGRTYTLPSEAQWEYASRAFTTTPFAFGHTLTAELANYRATETYGNGPRGEFREQTTPVGSFPANAWGLKDMHGNVWEWCLDHWHDSYEGGPEDGSAWLNKENEEEELRLLRGGSWFYFPGGCRSAYRDHDQPGSADSYVGFRVVCLPQGPSLNP